jgi:hypothetical protein
MEYPADLIVAIPLSNNEYFPYFRRAQSSDAGSQERLNAIQVSCGRC